MNYVYHPAAEADLLESVGFYEDRKPGLGTSFYLEFEGVMGLICQSPLQYAVIRPPGIRQAQLHRFPFRIIYKVSDSTVQILAVAHQRRHPDYWLERLGE